MNGSFCANAARDSAVTKTSATTKDPMPHAATEESLVNFKRTSVHRLQTLAEHCPRNGARQRLRARSCQPIEVLANTRLNGECESAISLFGLPVQDDRD